MPIGHYPHKRKPLSERFWPKVDCSGNCWPWMAVRNERGYGVVGRGGRGAGMILAHRASWELAYGPIPNGLAVLHRCDNPPCVRPEHLFLGTRADNNHDMITKGRRNPASNANLGLVPTGQRARGERNGFAKLTDQHVREIRQKYTDGIATQYALADEYGVTQAAIWYTLHRKTWRHLL